MPGSPFRPLLKPRDAAKALGVSTMTLRRWVHEGRLPAPVRLSQRHVAHRPEDLDNLCETNRQTERA